MASLVSLLPGAKKDDCNEPHLAGFGGHHIGWLGSLCLVCNNIIGPGLFQLPGLIQQAGWIPTLTLIALTALWTTQSALYLSKTMANFAGNGDFSKRLEFTKVTHHLLPRWGYMMSVITLSIVFFSQNVANILMTSQVMDSTLLDIFKKTCAFDWTQFEFTCVTPGGAPVTDSLFGDRYVISTGYLIVLVVCIPLGILNLDDNIGIQIGGMALTVVCIFVWMANFLAIGLDMSLAPAFSSAPSDWLPLLPTVLFNYGFVATVPSWLNEKSPSVHVTRTVIGAQVLASAQFLILAVFGALSIPIQGGASGSIVTMINQASIPGVWETSRIMTYIFPIANILTSIPVFSIIVRYNLLQFQGVHMPVWLANLFAVVLPWVVALPFYPGNTMDDVITWSSAVLFVHMNLIQPLWAYVESARRQRKGLPPIEVTEDGDPITLPAGSGGLSLNGSDGGMGGGVTDPLLLSAALEAGSPRGIEFLTLSEQRRPVGLKPASSMGGGGFAVNLLAAGAGLSGEPMDTDFGFAQAPPPVRDDAAMADAIRVLPRACGGKDAEYRYGYALFLFSFVLAAAAVALQVVQTANPNL